MRKSGSVLIRSIGIAGVVLLTAVMLAERAGAQDGTAIEPGTALQSMLTAACRQDEASFRNYLTKANGAAFAQLTVAQRLAIIKRFALLDTPGRPLLSDAGKSRVLACEGPGATVEFRIGAARQEENTAYIPVNVSGRTTQFGMVRESGGWRLLSLGLLLFDVPQLVEEWAQQDTEAREEAAAKALAALAEAIEAYQRSFGQLPDSLAQLGPAPPEGVSPDHADLIASDLATGSRNGYKYRYQILPAPDGSAANFELTATPEQYGKAGRRSFLLDGKGRIHAADKNGKVATVADPVLTVTGPPE
jgi:type II secretory pathway pseudopilin PulG